MKIKVIFSYEEIYENVEKIVPTSEAWDQVEIFYKNGLSAIPKDMIKEIVVLDD